MKRCEILCSTKCKARCEICVICFFNHVTYMFRCPLLWNVFRKCKPCRCLSVIENLCQWRVSSWAHSTIALARSCIFVLSCWKFKNTDSFRSSRRPATQVQHSYRQAFWKNWSRDKKTRFIHFEHERLNSAFTAVIWSCARSRSRDMPKVGTITSAFEVRRVS